MNLQQLTEYLIANTDQLTNLDELCNKYNINKSDVLKQLTATYKQLSNEVLDKLPNTHKDKQGNYFIGMTSVPVFLSPRLLYSRPPKDNDSED